MIILNFVSEKVIFNFLMQLFNCGKLNINSCGFYVLNKKSADESFKNYCISNGLLVTKLVSMLRAHGYLQNVKTKEITIQSNTFLRKFEQFKADQKSAGLSQKTTSKVDISSPSSSESEIDKSFSKVDLECHLAHYHEDMMFKDWKLGCFICQDSFRDRVDFNRHRKQHKDLNIEYKKSVL
ncbi:MOV10.2 family protein [Megaselia abdita]